MDNVKISWSRGSPRPKARSATYAGLQAVMEGAQRVDGVEVELVVVRSEIAPVSTATSACGTIPTAARCSMTIWMNCTTSSSRPTVL